jgi:hypothetical protein
VGAKLLLKSTKLSRDSGLLCSFGFGCGSDSAECRWATLIWVTNETINGDAVAGGVAALDEGLHWATVEYI